MKIRIAPRLVLLAAAWTLPATSAVAQTDPLPSWNDGPAQQAIVKFVGDVTRSGASTFVAPAERIAVFDNDGTLWSEQPLYFQLAFALDQVKLMAHLRANGFKTFIVSGGGIEFMRPWAEKAYGIPPEQVVGSSAMTKFEMRPEGPVLVKEARVEFVDDGPGKPVGINRFIGRRPILAFGNSDGDHQLRQWTAAGIGPRFMGIGHHTDAEREGAYDRTSHIGKLDKAWDEAVAKGWTVVDMKKDWKRIYPYDK